MNREKTALELLKIAKILVSDSPDILNLSVAISTAKKLKKVIEIGNSNPELVDYVFAPVVNHAYFGGNLILGIVASRTAPPLDPDSLDAEMVESALTSVMKKAERICKGVGRVYWNYERTVSGSYKGQSYKGGSVTAVEVPRGMGFDKETEVKVLSIFG